MRKLILIIPFLIIIFSCENEKQPKVDYKTQNDKKEIFRDSTQIIINELPIEIDSTDYLIYVIGEPNTINYRSSYTGSESGSYDKNNFSVTSSHYGDFTGKIHNLKFQKQETDTINELTDKTILISSFGFLREIFNQNQRQFLIYTVYDNDTNGDQRINARDLRTLYLSEINGQKFKKLAPDFQELIDWKTIKIQNRLYFRTIEDIDKNGKFNNDDKLHNFYIDFDDENLKVNEYNLI